MDFNKVILVIPIGHSSRTARSHTMMSMPQEPTTSDDIAILARPQSKVDEIVMMLANPRQARQMVRFSDDGTGAPTLLFKPQTDFTYDYTSAVADKQIPAREAMFILRKDAVVPLIYFDCNTAAALWNYTWYNQASNDNIIPIGGGHNYVEPYNAHAVSAYAPHGAVLPAFKTRHNSHRYIYVDGTSAAPSALTVVTRDNTAATTPVPAGQNVIVRIYQWDFAQDELAGTIYIPAGSSTGAFSITRGGYYRCEVFYSELVAPTPGTSIQSIFIGTSGTSGVFCHQTINNVNNIAESVSSERVLTSTIKISNASAPGFAAGMIYEADVYNGQPWPTLNQGSAQVGALDSVQTRPAAKGYYGFCRVENLDDFDMRRQMSINGLANQGVNSQEIYGDLDHDAPYKVVSFILPPPGTFPTDRFLNIELTTVLEAMGNTDLVEPEYPDTSPEQWEAALLIFSSIPSGYENPTHWRDILAAIGKVGATVTPAVAEHLRSITTGHPLLVALAQFGGNVTLPILEKGFQALTKLKKRKK